MAGVAGPMLQDRPLEGVRFLLGLTAGGVAAGLVVGTVAFLVGTGVSAVVAEASRLTVLAAACLALGVLDLRGHTPHLWRQVPQALVRVLPPGFLGAAWGFDIGLLFTTQKVSSLLWGALLAVTLLAPNMALVLVVAVAALSCLAIAGLSLTMRTHAMTHGTKRDRRWLMSLRGLTGLVLLAMAGATLARVIPM